VAHALRSRNWRRRGRRGQVAAVATLLGLLLVVTFIANFLTTIVPNQMSVNDLNHVIVVENQFGRLSALLASAGAQGYPGQQLVQPVTLGTDSVPPWTQPDSSALGSGRNGSNATLSYGLLGANVYTPPLGSSQAGPALPFTCTFTSSADVGIACTAAITKLTYNFSGNAKAFTVTSLLSTGMYALNYSTNHSTISISAVLGTKVDLGVYGSNDTVSLSVLGGSSINVTVVGNHDYLNLGATGTANVVVRNYGTSNSLYQSSAGAGKMLVISFGNSDAITANATAAMTYTAFVNGFNSTYASSQFCPYGNVSKTEALHGTGATATYNAFFNNTAYTGVVTSSPWTIHNQAVAPTNCPFFARQPIALRSPNTPGAGMTLSLHYSYAPSGEVAYDAGAVVFAQSGSYPVIIDAPSLSLTVAGIGGPVTAASIWLPFFSNRVGSVSGSGTETLNVRMLQTSSYRINANNSTFVINPNVPIVLVINTPYAAAWATYLTSQLSFSGLWTCLPAPICTDSYVAGVSLGHVTITIPTTNLQQFSVGTSIFSVALS
jgi:hypothetical protein